MTGEHNLTYHSSDGAIVGQIDGRDRDFLTLWSVGRKMSPFVDLKVVGSLHRGVEKKCDMDTYHTNT